MTGTFKKQFYKWHRICGLIALVPIMCWTLSGLSHPFMSNWFRPFIAQETFKPLTLDKLSPKLSLRQVLQQNKIDSLRNFGLVKLNGQTCYQVLGADSSYAYYSASTGMVLADADRQYAIQLARYFTQDSVSAIKSAVLQAKFDDWYQPINHLLPVWKVSLNRTDGMDVYVETSQSRMGTFNNNTRKTFLWLFEQLHTWDWLAKLAGDHVRLIVLMVIVVAMFAAMLSGLIIYGLFWSRFKNISQKRKKHGTEQPRFVHRFHRQLGLIVSFVMFTFLLSAGIHIGVKLYNNKPLPADFKQMIQGSDLSLDNLHLQLPDSLVRKTSLVKFNGRTYYQVSTTKKQVIYLDAANGSELKNGNTQFAAYLAGYYSQVKQPADSVVHVKQFTEEYGFINKRLPVEQVRYAGKDDWYIETTTQKLATHVAGPDRFDGFSFIFLHKYFGMAWAGKDVRDIVSMLAALGVLVVGLFGFAAFVKNK